jgi:hypothetical protein
MLLIRPSPNPVVTQTDAVEPDPRSSSNAPEYVSEVAPVWIDVVPTPQRLISFSSGLGSADETETVRAKVVLPT